MTAFASADDLSDYLGEELTGSRLVQAQVLLELATARIQSYVRQHIELVENDAMTLPGTYDWDLELPQRPVVEVSAITIDGQAVPSDSYRLSGSTLVRAGGWGGPAAVVGITYSHGYDPIPGDVKAVCLQLAVETLDNPQGVRQEGIGSYTVTYGNGGATSEVLETLCRYRRRVASPRTPADRHPRTYV